MVVALYLVASVAAGWAITYWCGVALRLEERVAFGMVLGPAAATMAAFLLAFVLGLGNSAILAGLVVAMALGAFAALRSRETIGQDARDLGDRWELKFRDPSHPWPLAAIVVVSWPYTVHVLRQAYVVGADGLYAGHLSSWADWSAHSSYAGAFSVGSNLPAHLPTAPSEPFRYHFLIDFFAANLTRLGISMQSALELTSLVLALAFPLILYVAAHRLTNSRATAVTAIPLFLLAGGLGFTYFFADLDQRGLAVLRDLPHDYVGMWDRNYWMTNPIIAYLYPQRPTLFGFSMVLIAVTVLWEGRREYRARPFVFAGVLAGLTPLFHGFSFATLAALGGVWSIRDRRREWLGFLLPAAVLALPAVLWLMPSESALRWQFGWMSSSGENHDNLLWFWLKNTGAFIPLMLFAHLRKDVLSTDLRSFLAPIWLWFVVPNFLIFHPWEWNNTHYFAFWQLFGSVVVAAGLVWMVNQRGTGPVLAAVCFFVLTFAGALDVFRLGDFNTAAIKLASNDGVSAAAWVRENTPPGSIFAVAPTNDEPVLVLGARPVVAGYPGWIWDLGVKDWSKRVDDVKQILRGEGEVAKLLERYDVDYVVVGPIERNEAHGATPEFWRLRAKRVYRNDEYEIFDVRNYAEEQLAA